MKTCTEDNVPEKKILREKLRSVCWIEGVTRCEDLRDANSLSKRQDSAATAPPPRVLQASLIPKKYLEGPGCGVNTDRDGGRVRARQGNPGVFTSPAMAIATELASMQPMGKSHLEK